MASAKRRPDGKWRARWRDLDGKEHAKHFALKRDADRFLATIEADKLRGQYVDPTDKTTVAEYAWRWASMRPHNARTARKVASTIRTHIEGTPFGAARLSRVLPSDAQAWAMGRSKVLGAGTLRVVVYMASSIFKAALADRLIGRTPFVNIALPEASQKRLVPLTVAQVRKVAGTIMEPCEAMVIAQAGLGLRIGELLALRVQDVDFLRRTVRIEAQIPPNSKTREDPKTELSKRTLPLPKFVADALAQRIAQCKPLADGTIFYNTAGGVWTTTHYGKTFGTAAARAGLPAGTTSHDLRHHYASVLLDQGESVIAVAERLGHRNANLVIKTYGHLMPDSEDRTRRALELAWSDADQVRTAGSSRAV